MRKKISKCFCCESIGANRSIILDHKKYELCQTCYDTVPVFSRKVFDEFRLKFAPVSIPQKSKKKRHSKYKRNLIKILKNIPIAANASSYEKARYIKNNQLINSSMLKLVQEIETL